jgi:plastocyanin
MLRILIRTLAPLSGALALLGLVACEGEPPKVPVNAPAAPAAPPAAPGASPAPTAPTPGMGMAGGTMPCHRGAETPALTPVPGSPSESGVAPGPAVPGTVPAPTPPVVTGAAAAQANITGHVITTPAQAAAHAVVYLEDAPITPGRGDVAGIDNHQMNFLPFVQVVTVGGKIAFTNSDPFPHNVFSPDNGRFDLGMVAQHGTRVHVFDKAGEYSLLCNLHPNMLGYVVVSPSSYFAKANAKGEFSIKDVPSGTYKITAWAPRQKTDTQPIVVKDADANLDFVLHR